LEFGKELERGKTEEKWLEKKERGTFTRKIREKFIYKCDPVGIFPKGKNI